MQRSNKFFSLLLKVKNESQSQTC